MPPRPRSRPFPALVLAALAACAPQRVEPRAQVASADRVDRQVASINRQVASVDRQVASVDREVASVDREVASVDRQVASVERPVERIERRVAAMGTVIAIEVEAPTRARALEASEAAVRALEATEARLSTWREDSELARLNAAAPGADVTLSPELAAELAAALAWSRATELAFDPAVGNLVRAWDLRGAGRLPGPDERRAACLPGGAPRALALEGRVARRLDPRLCLEEGGFGKGAGLDAALRALESAGATTALLDFGGQLALLGSRERCCAVADPRDRTRTAVEVTIDSGSLSTSGDSEHAFVVDGVRRGHLLDPRTGEPAPDFGSVTVWAHDALAADCLSTGLFVLGPEGALAFAELHDGVEVLVLEATSDGALVARSSSGLSGRVRPLDGRTTLSPIARPRPRSDSGPQPKPENEDHG